MKRTMRRFGASAICVLLAAIQAGCASAPRGGAESAGGAVSPERSAQGNPPFYEVFGRRYYVLDSAEDYVEQGTASWYGRDFHRLPTSSGERYDMYAMTAAHKTLPLPTWVEVTNLENGRTITVKVNDRGPFVGDRIIDLSYAAADALDMVRAGTARVEVRSLGSPSAAPQPAGRRARSERRDGARAVASAADAADTLFIQVGAFSEHGNAEKLVERLRRSGFENVFVVSDDSLHRVRVGPFHDVADYDRATDGLRRTGIGDTRLVVEP